MEWCKDSKSGKLGIDKLKNGIREYMMRVEEREEF
jgi:hypothetical protein